MHPHDPRGHARALLQGVSGRHQGGSARSTAMTSPGRYRSNYPRSAFDAPDLLHYTVLAGREPNLQTYRPRSDRRLLLQPTTAHTTVANMAAAA